MIRRDGQREGMNDICNECVFYIISRGKNSIQVFLTNCSYESNHKWWHLWTSRICKHFISCPIQYLTAFYFIFCNICHFLWAYSLMFFLNIQLLFFLKFLVSVLCRMVDSSITNWIEKVNWFYIWVFFFYVFWKSDFHLDKQIKQKVFCASWSSFLRGRPAMLARGHVKFYDCINYII